MKLCLLLAVLLVSACSQKTSGSATTTTAEGYDYFFYSQKAWEIVETMIKAGVKPAPNHSTVDGLPYTCWCEPEYVNTPDYKARFPDLVLVKKKKRGRRT